MSRRSLLTPTSVFTALLAVVFTMPKKFGFGTSVWYAKTALIVFILYVVDNPEVGLFFESVILFTFPIGIFFCYRLQRNYVMENIDSVPIKDLVKIIAKE